ncbi:MAG: glycosyltransferase family 25 protein [Pseudomonadales bacterium]|nr:glycosyltransferase family 25 protein [Pseudomonadales bacterium]
MTISAWIITLNAESENVEKLIRDLSTENINASIYPAVNGKDSMPALRDGESLPNFFSMINRKSKLTSTEVGCYLSHYRLIKQAYLANSEHIFILEDDVVIEPGLADLLENIVTLPAHMHLVRLMALKIRKRRVLRSLTTTYSLARPERGALGTQGYVLNREGMKLILDYGARITMPIDKLYDSFFLYGLNCYTIEPHAIYELANHSSVKKDYNNNSVPLWARAGWRINKLYRSIKRRTYYAKNSPELKNATKPKERPGKSIRLRD